MFIVKRLESQIIQNISKQVFQVFNSHETKGPKHDSQHVEHTSNL